MITDQNSYLEFLQAQRDKLTSDQREINKDIIEKQVINITQRREYFQHITILSLGLAGVTFFTDKVINKTFFILGFSFLIFTVLLILMWLRETLDKEGNELQASNDKYNTASEEKDELILEFAKKAYTPELVSEYYLRINNLPSIIALREVARAQSASRKNRPNQSLDYFGEFIIFFFCLGILFLFISVLTITLNYLLLSSVILLIFSISFQDFVIKKSGIISKFISYLHKNIIFPKEKKIGFTLQNTLLKCT